MQDSRNALNRSRTGKKTFFLISSFRFLDRFEWLSAEATFQNVASARRVALGQPSLVKISTSAISCLHFFQREALITMVKRNTGYLAHYCGWDKHFGSLNVL